MLLKGIRKVRPGKPTTYQHRRRGVPPGVSDKWPLIAVSAESARRLYMRAGCIEQCTANKCRRAPATSSVRKLPTWAIEGGSEGMALRSASEPALGIPGQENGQATLQSDRGDETQALFQYQWCAGFVLLAGALVGANGYAAIWCEHHDDLLGELHDGRFHAVQVKTNSGSNARWSCSDRGFADAIKKFAEHEAAYSDKFERFILFSNVKPYIPGATARASERLASSPVRVRDVCCEAASFSDVPAPYKASFDALVTHAGAPPGVVFEVMRKLHFQLGPSLEGFREALTATVQGVPACKQFTVTWLEKLRDELLFMVGKASSMDVPSINFYASVLQSDGRPTAAVRGKRVSRADFEEVIRQHPGGGFRYADVGGSLQLGSASGQKDVLRQKMNAGYVGPYFDALWLLAMSAEQRLLGEAMLDPESTLKKTAQLESVMLVECKTAELAASEEADESIRGPRILRRVFQRAEELAQYDRATVEGERAETLKGIAGLLSGDCKFAWGTTFNGGSSGT